LINDYGCHHFASFPVTPQFPFLTASNSFRRSINKGAIFISDIKAAHCLTFASRKQKDA
jgi:hypothetical protein